MGVRIRYGNYASEAKENFDATSYQSQFDTLDQLKKYHLRPKKYGNPCELYQTALDGTYKPFPNNAKEENIGFWSNTVSGEKGVFETPITISLNSERYFSSQSISLVFDADNGIYCNELLITWYRGGEEIESKKFFPNSAEFICENTVKDYNGISIVFYSINMPYNRLKVASIDHGYYEWFDGGNIKNIKIIQGIDPISSEISINTADLSLDLVSDKEVLFQPYQPIDIYFNDKLHSSTLIKDFKRKSKSVWEIKTEDYIGKMDGVDYIGGIYKNERAVDILNDIFSVAKVPFRVDDSLSEKMVSGYIPYTTCREALKQVCFAIQAVADTSYSDVVNVRVLSENLSQNIPLERIMQGQSFEYEEQITSVEITCHEYDAIDEQKVAYSAKDEDIGNTVFVKFSEPLHDFSIENGIIIEAKTNYAIIKPDKECVFYGMKYNHQTTIKKKTRDYLPANVKEKVLAVENATLVSLANVDNILEVCYNFYENNSIVSLRIVEGKHPNKSASYSGVDYAEYDKEVFVGDSISCQTEFLGDIDGRVIEQRYSLNGGIIIKNTKMKRTTV